MERLNSNLLVVDKKLLDNFKIIESSRNHSFVSLKDEKVDKDKINKS